MWQWQYYVEYSTIQTEYGDIPQNICQSHAHNTIMIMNIVMKSWWASTGYFSQTHPVHL